MGLFNSHWASVPVTWSNPPGRYIIVVVVMIIISLWTDEKIKASPIDSKSQVDKLVNDGSRSRIWVCPTPNLGLFSYSMSLPAALRPLQHKEMVQKDLILEWSKTWSQEDHQGGGLEPCLNLRAVVIVPYPSDKYTLSMRDAPSQVQGVQETQQRTHQTRSLHLCPSQASQGIQMTEKWANIFIYL